MSHPPTVQPDTCVCGHVRAAHEHYRRGSDCGVCGADTCAGFQLVPHTSATTLPRAAEAPGRAAHSG